MSLGFFILGTTMMIIGILATWRTTYFVQFFGDLGEMFGAINMPWMSWKLFGVIFTILGFLFAFNLFGLFFVLVFGRLFGISY